MIPVNFEVRADAHAMRDSRFKEAGEIKQNSLFTTGGKAEIRLRNSPATVSVRHFNAHRVCPPATSLCDRNVHGRLGVVNGPVRDQVKRSGCWRVIAEINFDVMIARQALKLAASEVVERFAIASAQEARDVVAIVVDRLFDRLRSRDCRETK